MCSHLRVSYNCRQPKQGDQKGHREKDQSHPFHGFFLLLMCGSTDGHELIIRLTALFLKVSWWSFWPSRCLRCKTIRFADYVTNRSEERRVGKECRSRWS